MATKSTKKTQAPLAQRIKGDPGLLARALKDPGLRSQLPDKYLNKEQQAARARREFFDNVGNIDEPLTGGSLVNVADQLTDRQYRPQFGALDAAETQTTAQRDQQQRWARANYDQLNGVMGGLVTSATGATTKSVGDADARRDAAVKAIDAAGGDVAKRAADDAAVRGGGLGQEASAADLAAQEAAAKGRATTGGQAAADAAQANGDAQAALLRGIQAATAQQGGETQGQISAAARGALADLASKRQELTANEGEDRTKNLVDLRGKEVDRLLTEKGISSDLTQAQMDADLKGAQIKSSSDLAREKMKYQMRLEQMGYAHDDAKQAADQQFQAEQNDLNRKNDVTVAETRKSSSAQDKPEFSNSERHTNLRTATNAIGAAKSLAGSQDRATALQYLTDKYGDIYARIAVNLAFDKGKGQKHLRQELLQLAGIHLPDKYISKA